MQKSKGTMSENTGAWFNNLAFFVHNCKPMVFRSRNVVLVVLVGIKGLLSVWECVENDAINCFYNFCRMLLKLKYKSYIKIP